MHDDILTSEDKEVIASLIDVIKLMITKYTELEISTIDLIGISKALFILENYPKITCEGCVEISAVDRHQYGMDSATMIIADSYFEIFVSGTVYDENVGSDSYLNLVYSSEAGMNGSPSHDLEYWEEEFHMHFESKINVTDNAEII